jgi:hypothetical protein
VIKLTEGILKESIFSAIEKEITKDKEGRYFAPNNLRVDPSLKKILVQTKNRVNTTLAEIKSKGVEDSFRTFTMELLRGTKFSGEDIKVLNSMFSSYYAKNKSLEGFITFLGKNYKQYELPFSKEEVEKFKRFFGVFAMAVEVSNNKEKSESLFKDVLFYELSILQDQKEKWIELTKDSSWRNAFIEIVKKLKTQGVIDEKDNSFLGEEKNA